MSDLGFTTPVQKYEGWSTQASVTGWPKRWWLHVLLFVITLATTTVFGFALSQGFTLNQPFRADWIVDGYIHLIHANPQVLSGLQFSVPLLLILLVHESGHYVACRRWHVNASLPYFLPSPTLMGTLGAMIHIRSAISRRRGLFDIGIAGPLGGFIVLVPFLGLGVWLSRVSPGIANHGDFIFGTPLLLRIAEWLRFPGIREADISLHPIARAAWAGLLATAFNLLPIGQLDGGHILYAFSKNLHRSLSWVFLVALAVLGCLFYWGWLLCAVLLFAFGMRHPLVENDTALGGTRKRLGVVAFFVFVLSISLVPVQSQ